PERQEPGQGPCEQHGDAAPEQRRDHALARAADRGRAAPAKPEEPQDGDRNDRLDEVVVARHLHERVSRTPLAREMVEPENDAGIERVDGAHHRASARSPFVRSWNEAAAGTVPGTSTV